MESGVTLSVSSGLVALRDLFLLFTSSTLIGCATGISEISPPNPLPALPTIYTDTSRTTATATEAPIGVNFKTTTQLKLQASQHWASIADDSGRAVVAILRRAGRCSGVVDQCASVYVSHPAVVTEFSRAFYNQIITTLVKANVPVAKEPTAGLMLDFDIQPITFSPNRPQYRYAGVATELGPGVWALRDVSSVSPRDAQIVPPTVDALHWFRSEFASGRTPQTEILITVSISDKSKYLSRVTNAYYVEDGDRRLYDQEICSLFKLCPIIVEVSPEPKGGKGDTKKKPPKEERGLSVVGDCLPDKCESPSSINSKSATQIKK